MKRYVICIGNCNGGLSLTIDKMYVVIKENYNFYLVNDDRGCGRWIDKDRFRGLTISEKREVKLESIGI